MQGLPAGRSAAEDGRGVVGRLRGLAAGVAVAFGACALAMLAVHVLAPQRVGPLAFTEVFEPYLLVALLSASALFAALAWQRTATVMVVIVLIASAMRYGPAVVSFPAALPRDAQPLRLMSWNLEAGGVSNSDLATTINRVRPDVVGLIELVPESSHAVDSDERMQALFPYRVMLPRSGAPGLGLLSRFPVVSSEFTRVPPMLKAVVLPSDSEPPITIFVAHPYLAAIETNGVVPDIDTRSRDADIALIRAQIDAELAAGNDVLVLGDFNVTEREPAYSELSRGLHDAQREAGYGLGLTWRPQRIENLPFGLLRIDYMFASAPFVALSAAPDCTPRGSDHCLVTATFARPRIR